MELNQWKLGPVPRNMVKLNPRLSQILRKVFLSKNMHVTHAYKILEP